MSQNISKNTGNYPLMITRIFDAPREKVWHAWTDPKMIKKWWGPKDFTAPEIGIDLREGGKYLYCMRGVAVPGGEVRDFWNTGTFHVIVPTEKIVIKDNFADANGKIVSPAYYGLGSDFPMEMQIIIMFADDDSSSTRSNKTRLTLKYPDLGDISAASRRNMEQGWNQSLDKLAEALEQMPTDLVRDRAYV